MMEMMALFVGYFFYEAGAPDWWWVGYWIILGLYARKQLSDYRKEMIAKMEKEVKEQRIYWEGKEK